MTADWALVILTAIYVIVTSAILWANYKSMKASEEQVREMRHEFESVNRPIIEVEFIYLGRSFYGLRFVNRGNHTAQRVRIHLDSSFIDSLKEPKFKTLIEAQDGKECVIGVNQHHDIFFGSNEYRKTENKPPASGVVEYYYQDVRYEVQFCIDTENYTTWYSIENEEEKIIKKLGEISGELKKIKETIGKMNNCKMQ